MRIFPRSRLFPVALVLAAYLAALQAAPALAAVVPSRLSDGSVLTSTREADLLAVQRMLEHKWVAQRLQDYGVRPAEVQAKLAQMPDQDLHALASYSHGLPSGGDGLGTVIALLVIVILVIVVLKLLNKEVVIK
jgi:hypothetical protein